MNIYRKIFVEFSNFFKYTIGGINIRKKNFKKIRKSINFYHSLKSKEIKHL